ASIQKGFSRPLANLHRFEAQGHNRLGRWCRPWPPAVLSGAAGATLIALLATARTRRVSVADPKERPHIAYFERAAEKYEEMPPDLKGPPPARNGAAGGDGHP